MLQISDEQLEQTFRYQYLRTKESYFVYNGIKFISADYDNGISTVYWRYHKNPKSAKLISYEFEYVYTINDNIGRDW